MTRLRGRLSTVDPWNLTQIMLAEGNKMNVKSKSSRTRILAEISIFSALAAVLYTIRPYTFPYGGSITLGSMVPIMYLSLRRGVRVGLITGAVVGPLALLIDVVSLGGSSVVVSPQQVFLEYPLAFSVIGLTGMFHRKPVKSFVFVLSPKWQVVPLAILGAGISVFIRFLIHYFVGVYVWYYVYAFPTGYGQYVYPAIYNGSFLLVEFIISALILTSLIVRGALDYAL